MISDMTSGFVKVISAAGTIVAILLVLAIVGAANQHAKLLSMAAVGDGLADVLKWIGSLLGQALSHL